MATRSRHSVPLPWEHRRARFRAFVARLGVMGVVRLALVAAALLALGVLVVHQRRLSSTRTAIGQVRDALGMFRRETGRCPRSTRELVQPTTRGRVFLRVLPRDGWGRTLYVSCPSAIDPGTVDVVSAGPEAGFFDGDEVL